MLQCELAEAQREAYHQTVFGRRAPSYEEEVALREQAETSAPVAREPIRPPLASSEASPARRRRQTLGTISKGDRAIAQQQQQRRNTELRTATLAAVEGIISVAEALSSSISAKKPQLVNRLSASLTALHEFHDGMKSCTDYGWDRNAVIREVGIEMTGEALAAAAARGIPDPLPVKAAVRELCSSQEERIAAKKARLVKLHGDLDVCDRYAPQPVADLVVRLHELLHTDALADVTHDIRRTDTTREKLHKRAADLQLERDNALRVRDVVTAEALHEDLIDTREQLLDLMRGRMAQLLFDGDNEEAQGFASQRSRLIKDADEAVNAFAKYVDQTFHTVEQSIMLNEEVHERKVRDDATAAAAFAAATKNTLTILRENAASQQQTLDELAALAQRLEQLAHERKQVIEAHLAAKEKEERRSASHAEFLEAQAALNVEMLTLRDQLEACGTISAALLHVRHEVVPQLEKRDVPRELCVLAAQEGVAYLDEYRDYVFATGDLLTKKQHRADVLERQQRLAKLQKDSALEALDPSINTYTATLETLAADTLACQTAITHLQQKLTKATSDFTPTEALLRTHGVEFRHPYAEFAERSTEQRGRFVEQCLRFLEAEERELDKKRQSITLMRAAASTHKQIQADHPST